MSYFYYFVATLPWVNLKLVTGSFIWTDSQFVQSLDSEYWGSEPGTDSNSKACVFLDRNLQYKLGSWECSDPDKVLCVIRGNIMENYLKQ